jgi:hypothetical protein
MKLTTAHNYLSTLYERCIDSGMNVDAIRLYLAEQGIRKTPAQVVDDLNNFFCFAGYAATHQPESRLSVAEFDRRVDLTR